MEYEEIEKLSLEESKRQTKERRQDGLNMIRPFTFDEKKILWDGLYNEKNKRKKYLKEMNYRLKMAICRRTKVWLRRKNIEGEEK